MSGGLVLALVCAVVAILYGVITSRSILALPAGNARMQEIAKAIQEGASAYLNRQYTTIGIVGVILFFAIGFALSWPTAIGFLIGAVLSGAAGYIGMNVSVRANVRTAEAARGGLAPALSVAFRGGAITGMLVVGLGLLGVAGYYGYLMSVGGSDLHHTIQPLVGLAFGGSLISIFARLGGGIFTKGADVGADLVGKVEAGIPEDDPRNPATIADNVGDNVGDVAGMGADLYESYCGAILATAALGAALPGLSANMQVGYVTAPMIIAGVGTILSVAGIFAVRCKEGASMMTLLRALRIGTWGSSALIIVAAALMAQFGIITWGVFGATIAGLLAGVAIGYSTEYYTSDEYAPTKGVATQAKMGPATVLIEGLAVGMMSAAIPVVVTVIAILASFILAGGLTNLAMGLYGIAFSAVGMLATLGITLATDAYGPIADNAGGNAEMSHLPPGVRERTDALDMLGNTTAATGKGFAIASAALTALALVAAALQEVDIWLHKMREGLQMPFDFASYDQAAAAGQQIQNLVSQFNLTIMNPFLIGGAFIGAMMSFVFCAMTMKAVGRAAGAMVEEVRRQFRTKPGIMAGTDKPDYAMCVAISTKGAQREMMLPALMAIIVPVATGLVLGVAGIMGLLVGALTAGFSLACMLNNAGGAWDNAKKHIEKGNFGGKRLPDGSKNPIHAAAVIGDTVGDPCKDTSGPSMNILVKLMSMVAVVFMPVIIKFSPMIQKALRLVAE